MLIRKILFLTFPIFSDTLLTINNSNKYFL